MSPFCVLWTVSVLVPYWNGARVLVNPYHLMQRYIATDIYS